MIPGLPSFQGPRDHGPKMHVAGLLGKRIFKEVSKWRTKMTRVSQMRKVIRVL